VARLFDRFDAPLRAAGYIAMSGQIVDASLVAAPRQRNTKQAIKDSRIPEAWKGKPAKLSHKDRDARWTVKFTKPSDARMAPCRGLMWPSLCLDIRTMLPLIVALASS
jgi:hypothetical protein